MGHWILRLPVRKGYRNATDFGKSLSRENRKPRSPQATAKPSEPAFFTGSLGL